jgi:hypothetical protein
MIALKVSVRDYYSCGLIFWVFIWAYRRLFFVVWLGFFVDVDGGFVWDDDDDEVLEIVIWGRSGQKWKKKKKGKKKNKELNYFM